MTPTEILFAAEEKLRARGVVILPNGDGGVAVQAGPLANMLKEAASVCRSISLVTGRPEEDCVSESALIFAKLILEA